MEVSITKAAELAGVSRTTIYSDIKSGKVSFIPKGKNKKVINISELERAYGSLKINKQSSVHSNENPEHNLTKTVKLPDTNIVELAVLREKIDIIETERRREREQYEERIEQLQETLSKAQDNQSKTTGLLEHYTKEGGSDNLSEKVSELKNIVMRNDKSLAEVDKKSNTLNSENKDLRSSMKVYKFTVALLALGSVGAALYGIYFIAP